LAMTKLACDGEPRFVASDYERLIPPPSYAVNVMRALTLERPAVSFTLLLGADNFDILTQWKDIDTLLATVPIVVGGRSGKGESVLAEDLIARHPGRLRKVATPLIDIASTDLRHRVAHGRPIRFRTPPAVEDYILNHRLYRT